MKLLKLENSIIISPLLVNIGLSYAMMQLDIYLESYTLYMLLALLAMTIYPVFAALLLKTKIDMGLYLLVHVVTSLLVIYTVYNDSALIYFYISLALFTLTAGISMIVRKTAKRQFR